MPTPRSRAVAGPRVTSSSARWLPTGQGDQFDIVLAATADRRERRDPDGADVEHLPPDSAGRRHAWHRVESVDQFLRDPDGQVDVGVVGCHRRVHTTPATSGFSNESVSPWLRVRIATTPATAATAPTSAGRVDSRRDRWTAIETPIATGRGRASARRNRLGTVDRQPATLGRSGQPPADAHLDDDEDERRGRRQEGEAEVELNAAVGVDLTRQTDRKPPRGHRRGRHRRRRSHGGGQGVRGDGCDRQLPTGHAERMQRLSVSPDDRGRPGQRLPDEHEPSERDDEAEQPQHRRFDIGGRGHPATGDVQVEHGDAGKHVLARIAAQGGHAGRATER